MKSFSEPQDFTHPELGQEVTAIGGHYVFGKEIRWPFSNREILYFVGYAVLDSTCCGVGGGSGMRATRLWCATLTGAGAHWRCRRI